MDSPGRERDTNYSDGPNDPCTHFQAGIFDWQRTANGSKASKLNSAGCGRRVVDAVDLRLEIFFLGIKDILDPCLRVSVNKRKPRTLDLDHHAVTRLESVMDVT